jgi:hypothetical protein
VIHGVWTLFLFYLGWDRDPAGVDERLPRPLGVVHRHGGDLDDSAVLRRQSSGLDVEHNYDRICRGRHHRGPCGAVPCGSRSLWLPPLRLLLWLLLLRLVLWL